MEDRMLHITLMDGMMRGLLLTATDTVAHAAAIHLTSSVATAALGRALMGTAMLGAMLKSERSSVTVTIDGGGPLGRIVCAGDRESVRGYVENPNVEMPLKPNGKLDVGRAVGGAGRMSVVRDEGMKSPYVGQVPLLSGEIAEDFANYYLTSEQTPTLQSLGVLVSGDRVLTAGGVLLQPMPDCPDEVISQLELRSPMMADISRELAAADMRELMEGWFEGMKPVVLEEGPLSYRCSCSRERMESALIAMGREELERMIEDEQDGAELTCHFCKKTERFTQQDLLRLLNRRETRKEVK